MHFDSGVCLTKIIGSTIFIAKIQKRIHKNYTKDCLVWWEKCYIFPFFHGPPSQISLIQFNLISGWNIHNSKICVWRYCCKHKKTVQYLVHLCWLRSEKTKGICIVLCFLIITRDMENLNFSPVLQKIHIFIDMYATKCLCLIHRICNSVHLFSKFCLIDLNCYWSPLNFEEVVRRLIERHSIQLNDSFVFLCFLPLLDIASGYKENFRDFPILYAVLIFNIHCYKKK